MPSTDSSLVFVYGTLRKDSRGQVLSPLCRDWIFVGYGSVGGRLYDFGAYPGAVPSDDPEERIRGEVYELPAPETMLPPIDRYEGCSPEDDLPHEFERKLVTVEMEDGSEATAWIYWYRPQPRGRLLPTGDYLERMRPSRRPR
ncbi:MAG: gamma-glutamylcyclotransferase [Gemmatimonadota bacterium]|jgi:gamma-glutamylcyclotransferase (GGCT)/AIG2-like uncharacterized protein YtfP